MNESRPNLALSKAADVQNGSAPAGRPAEAAPASTPEPHADAQLHHLRASADAAMNGWLAFLQASQKIGRAQLMMVNQETHVAESGAEAMLHAQNLSQMMACSLRCAELQSDLAIHNMRAAIDAMRHAWFDIAGSWSRALHLSGQVEPPTGAARRS